jgi:hypothetical protein
MKILKHIFKPLLKYWYEHQLRGLEMRMTFLEIPYKVYEDKVTELENKIKSLN